MLQKLRTRSQSESGFTLVELLVVMLILGLLAAIAIPAFFNQREKAQDSEAKTQAQTAQTALETYATDNDGSFAGATVEDLEGYEPTLENAEMALGNLGGDTYTITVTSDTGNTFQIARANTGAVTHPCETEGEGGCPQGGWG